MKKKKKIAYRLQRNSSMPHEAVAFSAEVSNLQMKTMVGEWSASGGTMQIGEIKRKYSCIAFFENMKQCFLKGSLHALWDQPFSQAPMVL